MDLTETIAPRSDQANADDFVGGARTFTIREVRQGNSQEQPVDVVLEEFPHDRPWKPNKSMRRVLVSAWGVDTEKYIGRRVTLFCDQSVKWAGQAVGGIRIAALSHIDRPLVLKLTETRAKRAPFHVDVLPDSTPVSPVVSAGLLSKLTAMLIRKGVPEDKWLAGVNHYTNGAATALEVITEAQARQMLDVLSDRPDAVPTRHETAGVPGEPAAEPEELPGGWGDVEVAQIGGTK